LEVNTKRLKPFLRWAGGKNWLIKFLSKLLTEVEINQYHEPFVGGGSVFFYLQHQTSFLSDLNPKLIHTYQAVRDDVEEVINELNFYNNTEADYYRIRQSNPKSDYKKAARFIYLNQTSFNGIYRENLKGVYNVPVSGNLQCRKNGK